MLKSQNKKFNLLRISSLRAFIGILFISIILTSAKLAAQSINNNSNQKIKYAVKSKSPFKLYNNLIVFALSINHSPKMNFILDTGVKPTIITEFPKDINIEFNYNKELKIKGIGEGNDIDVWHTQNNNVQLTPDFEGYYHDIYILKQDEIKLSEQLGVKINGIIGADMFQNYIVEINYIKKTLTFYKPNEINLNNKRFKKFEIIPLIIYKSKPYLEAKVNQQNNEQKPVKLLLDLGSSDALWLINRDELTFDIPEKSFYSYLGKGLNGNISGYRAKINNFQIGEFHLQRPIVSIIDTNYISLSSLSIDLPGRNGSIGSEILQRFNLIIDYPNKQLLLKKNSNFKKPFTYNMSGLDILKPSLISPAYYISKVRKNSPSYSAGLKVGDQIVSINNHYAEKYALDEILALFYGKKGNKIRIKIKRAGIIHKFNFRLQDIL
jgi:hypothetical protein